MILSGVYKQSIRDQPYFLFAVLGHLGFQTRAYIGCAPRTFRQCASQFRRHGRITVSEKNRRYYERLKQDPERYQKWAEKQRIRKEKLRSRLENT
jgi:hypothetical protein